MIDRIFSLHQFNQLIRTVLETGFPDRYLVTAEIASLRIDQKGHCYLELVERDESAMIAQMRATIWSGSYRAIANQFRMATGMALAKGMKVLMEVEVTFHERFGLSLNINDIDPSYTLGEMALKRREILDRLEKEGLLERNRGLEMPLLPLRIAIISSPGAAGYGDFVNHVRDNPYGYRFRLKLFKAVMQGDRVEPSVIDAFKTIRKGHPIFDVVVIIRGGGGEAELHAFDSYRIGREVAGMPLPVISGIGHERDRTVVDEVAHTAVKTPTAAAELLIQRVREFHLRILDLESRLLAAHRVLMQDSVAHLYRLSRDMERGVAKFLAVEEGRLDSFRERCRVLFQQRIRNEGRAVVHIKSLLVTATRSYVKERQRALSEHEKILKYLDPRNVMKRGYSITYKNGILLNNTQGIAQGDMIRTVLFQGRITSRVTEVESDDTETRADV
ncbi:MAG: exodeoxyribonuclease VII large subunit [bacterium]